MNPSTIPRTLHSSSVSFTSTHPLTLDSNSELAREKMWGRIYLIPALQAEEDRDLVRRMLADRAREKELLGTETSPYNSDRYVIATVHEIRAIQDRLLEHLTDC
jgi:hypothetical protein